MSAIIEAIAAYQSEATVQADADERYRKVLSFNVANDAYAIPIGLVKEILEYGAVTRVPMSPTHIRGVLNLRGAVVPVIDLAARLGRPRQGVTRRTCIVILAVPDEEGAVDMGVVVDGVNEVLDIPEREIEPAPAFGSNIPTAYIHGIGKVRDCFVVILDTKATFDTDELSAGTQAARDCA